MFCPDILRLKLLSNIKKPLLVECLLNSSSSDTNALNRFLSSIGIFGIYNVWMKQILLLLWQLHIIYLVVLTSYLSVHSNPKPTKLLSILEKTWHEGLSVLNQMLLEPICN